MTGVVAVTGILGVDSPSRVGTAPLDGSFDFRFVAIARMICSGLAANSCAFSLGGGRKGEPGDGKGDDEV